MRRNTIIRVSIATTLGALAVFSLSACADGPGGDSASGTEQGSAAAPETGARETGASARNGVVTTSAGRYVFTAATCAAGMEGGAIDAEISGPGTAPDGEPIFVDFSSTAQALSIGLGVDKPFSSPERQLRGGQYVTRPFSVTLTGQTVLASEIVLAADDGSVIDDKASFEVDCG